MIKTWYVSNFKSIKDATEIPLNPLTIVVGANSSGKSTLLQSILLIAQTLRSRAASPLVLNGELVRLGAPDNILHFENYEAPLEIYFELALSNDYIPSHFALHSTTTDIEGVWANLTFAEWQRQFRLDRSEFEITTTNLGIPGHQYGGKGYIKAKREEQNILQTLMLSDLSVEDLEGNVIQTSKNQVAGIEVIKPPSVGLVHFLPNRLYLSTLSRSEFVQHHRLLITDVEGAGFYHNNRDYQHNFDAGHSIRLTPALREFLRKATHDFIPPQNCLTSLDNAQTIGDVAEYAFDLCECDGSYEAFNDFLTRVRDNSFIPEDLLNEEMLFDREIPPPFRRGLSDLERYFQQQIHYLGPLRDDPRVIYSPALNPEELTVGLKGEFTAAMLTEYRDKIVACPMLSDDFTDEIYVVEVPLIEAVNWWLDYTGLVGFVETFAEPGIGYRMTVTESGSNLPLPLTSVGVGVSQVLPTFVMGLLIPPPCTFLIEQPELHLHPRVQSILGDFFLGLTYCGKQCIVETHSEHIYNRVRLRIAVDDTGELQQKTQFLFVSKVGTGSEFKPVQPNKFGNIESEPAGFFDQATIEAQKLIAANIAHIKAESEIEDEVADGPPDEPAPRRKRQG